MDAATWNALVEVCRSTHTTMMAEGAVSPPTLWPFRGGRMIGWVSLRPVHVGHDASNGIAEMSTLAAASGADEVIVTWETSDIAAACALAEARPAPSLMLLWATTTQRLLYEFPYQEQALPGHTEHGLIPIAPRWGSPSPGITPEVLEPAITTLVEFCFQPLGVNGANVDTAAAYLQSSGYSVRLTQQ